MSEVRRLPEFKKLVAELNLVEYWRAYGWLELSLISLFQESMVWPRLKVTQ
jgi:hypothetical protein